MTLTKCLALVIVASTLYGDDGAANETDKEKLQGAWRVIATEFDGRPLSEGMLRGRQVVFKDDTFAAVVDGVTKKTMTFTIDSTHKPSHLDVINKEKQETAHGIFKFSKGELWLCYGEPGASRPTEFASPSGQRVFFMILVRDKS